MAAAGGSIFITKYLFYVGKQEAPRQLRRCRHNQAKLSVILDIMETHEAGPGSPII